MDRISITKFAELTGFSRRTIHRWITQGRVTPRRTPGGQPYFTDLDVMLVKARSHTMTDEEIEAQRQSWVRGEMGLRN